ncbi:MAG: SusC/RagA family TonB-linked outer membrane protein, partial [Chitinophagaceae bacterium]|nr:SusC/RagA family TonB-linked outer membrane protein [Chitinophagaceae bacterium]
VTVKVTGTTIGTQTNASGKFTLAGVPASAKSLTFSFVGFESQAVSISGGVANAVLSSDTKTLNEVVVSAGGLAISRKAQGYATTQIKSEELTQGKATNVGAALSGKVAGLQVNVVSSGVNPTVRLVLRGNRSFTGNNQALLVLDNNIVPSSVLGNLNPEDIDDIQVLNGAGGAALYGSDASNGAIIITTKKGKNGVAQIRASQTISNEHVSYYPKLQDKFGSGSANDVQEYIPYENQQYGPAFDGVVRQIGYPLANGAIQSVPYQFNNSKNDFWQTGVSKQSDFSIQAGDDKSSTYVSGQYFTNKGTTPGDAYNRFSIRANGTRKLPNHFAISYNTNYVQNRYDITSATGTIYDQLQQTPGEIVVTDYKDYLNNPFADINGYYNAYYANPYFTAANNRSLVRNDYFIGNAEVKYAPLTWLDFTFRVGLTSTNQTNKDYTNKYTLSAYTKGLPGAGGVKTADGAGSVADGDSFTNLITSEFYGTFHKQVKDFNVSFTAAASIRGNKSQSQTVSATGLLLPGLYNVGQRTTPNTTGGETQALTRQQAIYGNLQIGYKGYLNLHVTGRNDWLSVLAPKNRSFFYPSVDASFVPTEAFTALKNNKILSSLKLRGGLSKVGQANIGAYALLATFSPGAGYPYGTGPGYSQGDGIVSNDLKPEITKGWEAGFDAEFLDSRISTSVTYYATNTTNQTLGVSISNASGFSSYLTNTGEVANRGWETSLSVIPFKSASGWQLTVGANFVFLDNKVVSIVDGLNELALGNGTYAIAGSAYPMYKGTDYTRDAQGRVIVDKLSGAPSNDGTLKVLGNTNAKNRLGLNFEVKYKTVRLSALAEYRGNFVIYNAVSTSFDFSGSGIRNTYYNRERFVFPNSVYLDGTGNSVPNTNITVR